MTVRGVGGREVRVMVGSVDVICQHKAEMRIHVKKLTRYLEKQALDKPNRIAPGCFQGPPSSKKP